MQCTAFSYTRFSTLKQKQGDSGRRQIESARKYAAERGYILDESIEVDRGKSAWTGRNISEGALDEFTQAYRVEDDSLGIHPDR
jgi:DNA invertase Pin-like site-specific DNA recombinase